MRFFSSTVRFEIYFFQSVGNFFSQGSSLQDLFSFEICSVGYFFFLKSPITPSKVKWSTPKLKLFKIMCCNLVPGRVKAPLHFLYWRDAVSLIPYLPSNRSIYVRLLSGEAHFWAYRKLQPFKWTKAKRHVFRMHPIFKKTENKQGKGEWTHIERGKGMA